MIRLSWAGFRERWPLFLGAVVTTALGVALAQSSLVLLLAVAGRQPAPGAPALEAMTVAAARETGVALMGVTLGFGAFLAVFIIASTFAFTVAQRRRDLALLRLVGGSRRQLRRVLTGEAVLLGTAGGLAGIPAGLGVQAVQTWLLRDLGFVPAGFAAPWLPWVPGVSLGSGIGLAVAGVLVAARRAAAVRPLEALRESGAAARAMTRGRWWLFAVTAAGAVALVVLAPVGGAAGGQAMAISVSVCAALAFTAISPLLVPALGRLLPSRVVPARLASANLREGVRRSASIAAPVIVLTGLVLGQATAAASFASAGQRQAERDTVADFVVAGPVAADVPGVAVASAETEVPVVLTVGSGELAYTETRTALVVEPAAYERVHPASGSLAAVHGPVVAAGPGGDGVSAGDTIGVRFGDLDLGRLPVVAEVPAGAGGGPALLLPRGLLPDDVLAGAATRTFVTVAPSADRAEVAGRLAASGRVLPVAQWLADTATTRDDTTSGVLLVVMGLGGLFAAIGVVNSVVIATGERRREFATARVSGLTRGQVLRAALLESGAVTAAGLVLGLLAAAGTLLAALAATDAVTGSATAAVPWPLVVGVAAGSLVLSGVSSLVATWSATRPSPVSLLGARD
ncbi:putative ABC transport system permease protein [Lentzea xinjiangensis]|uniref:Putative ABC transport system permease protein n=1 Tax=Lentzea xinjiangensis TaxID=402600 RepID=A0A1H9WA50_9PSEU|nr:ABC transporter permease [Lentzea xinjiangensis]SES30353.1 putative ABC transport system permease protein [Lentzea xinjiangensis]